MVPRRRRAQHLGEVGRGVVAEVPKFQELINPVLEVLRQSGGSVSNAEMADLVIDLMQLPSEVADQPARRGSVNELEYRLGWARTYLKGYGLVTNSARGIWSLTPDGRTTTTVDPDEVIRAYNIRASRAYREARGDSPESPSDADGGSPNGEPWREQLLTAVHDLLPDAFERLCQRMLRESGFTAVTVTGRSGDGGIDGHGIIRMGGLISFPILFQCKRYSGSVTPSLVRDFRGAMQGRSDKGLIITTGTFTRDATREASRDGAPPIDLIDGNLLAEKLKELSLGVKTEMVERVTIDTEWFKGI